MGHPKFQFKNKCKSKATANHCGVNYRSGIIPGVMQSIVENTDANGRASGELSEWVEIVRKAHKRRIQIFAYANNHYAGHAPATVELFRDMLRKSGLPEPSKPRRKDAQPTLFD